MAVPAAVVRAAAAAASDKRVQKFVLYIVLGVVIITVAIVAFLVSIITGTASLIFGSGTPEDTAAEWENIRTRIVDVFTEVNITASEDIRKDIFTFEPNFTVEISKLALEPQKNYPYPVFTEKERVHAVVVMEKIGDEMRGRLPDYIDPDDDSEYLDPVYDVNQRPFVKDSEYQNGGEFDDYSGAVQKQLAEAAKNSGKLPSRKYEEKNTVVDGKSVIQKSLTVTDKDGNVKIVEFNVASDSVSIPHFLALYQTKNSAGLIKSVNSDNFEADLALIDEKLGGSANDDELYKNIIALTKQSWDNNANSKKNNIFSELDGKALSDILRANFKDGFFGTDTQIVGNKLIITVSAPDEKKLYKAFGLDEKLDRESVVEFENIISGALNNANIPQSNFNLPIDKMLDLSLFTRFEGFFPFPADVSKVSGYNTVFGQIDDLHNEIVQDGMTIQFKKNEMPEIFAGLKYNRKCITGKKVTSSGDSVTVEYALDTDKFETEYGFPFSELAGEEVSGTIEFYVKYSCLDSVTASSSTKIGTKFVKIGTATSGGDSGEHDVNRFVPHIQVEIYYRSDGGTFFVEPRLFMDGYEKMEFEPAIAEPHGTAPNNNKSILQYPLDPKWHLITTFFGYDSWRNGYHYGVDVGDYGIKGADVFAAADGTVQIAYYDITREKGKTDHGGWGNYVLISHNDGLQTRYAHLLPHSFVKSGDKVTAGQKIGEVGVTGYTSGAHLHFEVLYNGERVNPLNYYDSFP